ncbi:MAG TPA: hypothetical protein DD381_13800 [Lentisphaeria bacterium]|nr:MAG: hypothetical protein A2X47_13725 [Lentisphaerae bacterium GWF2_38_69]HBM17396.1 hypothetical protein [Lentisphaeria bacterium]
MNIVRFAPSPTGNVHIGNIRTAIFNWLFARHTKGQFLLRIEDTDKERSTKEAIDRLLECMDWLGLDHDSDIFYQSSQEELHIKAAMKMLSHGNAYSSKNSDNSDKKTIVFKLPYDCSTVKNVREVGVAEFNIDPGKPVRIALDGLKFFYINEKKKSVETAASLAGFKGLKVYDENGSVVFELEKHISEIHKSDCAFSFENCSKISFIRREVFYKDLIKGELAKPLDTMKDFVILRSDSSPIFHLSNVYDDITQKVTHIIRGDDHVENTYKHLFLFWALGADIPNYGHMPMIVNHQGKPYSKRDGDAFVGDFREKGYLSDALFNYLSLLGWSPGDNREKMTRSEMVEAFSLDRVKSAPAQFDIVKLLNINGLYMAELQDDIFLSLARTEAEKQLWLDSSLDSKLFSDVAELMKSRVKLISQVADWKYFFFDESPLFSGTGGYTAELNSKAFSYDEKGLKKAFKEKDSTIGALSEFMRIFRQRSFACAACYESSIRDTEKELSLQEGKLNQPLRIVLTGTPSGADLANTMAILGKDRIINRLEKLLTIINGVF